MKNAQKGSILVNIIIIILVLFAVMAGLFFMTSLSLKQARQEAMSKNQSVPTQVVSTSDITTIPSGWKKYTDQKLGFSVAYPSNWTVVPGLLGVTISAPRQDIDGEYGNMIVDSSWKLVLGNTEKIAIIDSLTKSIEQGSNATVSGIKAIKSVEFNNDHLYRTNINFVANSKYDLITELWAASGIVDNVKAGMRSDATKILNQITSSLVIK